MNKEILQQKIEEEKEYQAFLVKNGYTKQNKSDFIIEKIGKKVRLSKILGIFTYK